MGDELSQLLMRHAVALSQLQVKRQLFHAVKRHQRGDGDQAAFARVQRRPLPDIVKQDAVAELRQLGGDIAERLLPGLGF